MHAQHAAQAAQNIKMTRRNNDSKKGLVGVSAALGRDGTYVLEERFSFPKEEEVSFPKEKFPEWSM